MTDTLLKFLCDDKSFQESVFKFTLDKATKHVKFEGFDDYYIIETLITMFVGEYSTEMINYFLARLPSLDLRRKYGQHGRSLAQIILSINTPNKNLKISYVKRLLEQEPTIINMVSDYPKENILFTAMRAKAPIDFINYLLDKNVNVNIKDIYGDIPLSHCARNASNQGYVDLLRRLVELGNNVNNKAYSDDMLYTRILIDGVQKIFSSSNKTPLFWACIGYKEGGSSLDAIKTLIELGADTEETYIDTATNHHYKYTDIIGIKPFVTKKKAQKLYISKECLVCYKKNSEADSLCMLLPCNHAVICLDCLNKCQQKKCCYCNQEYDEFQIICDL